MKKYMLLPMLALFAIIGTGCGVTTRDGEHIGYVTAVEKNGLIWHTGTVYFKTKLDSSQEDKYCVESDDVIAALKDANEKELRVKLRYHNEIVVAPWRCGNDEIDIVDSVEVLK